MDNKSKYTTRQKKELEEYMETIPGVHVTAAQVRDYFRAQGKDIGTATIYRQLERMVSEGLVSKYIIDSKSSACFAYIGESEHVQDSVCFHCKCEKCGRLIHLDCDELRDIQTHLLEHHGFAWDTGRTVFYGLCDRCREA